MEHNNITGSWAEIEKMSPCEFNRMWRIVEGFAHKYVNTRYRDLIGSDVVHKGLESFTLGKLGHLKKQGLWNALRRDLDDAAKSIRAERARERRWVQANPYEDRAALMRDISQALDDLQRLRQLSPKERHCFEAVVLDWRDVETVMQCHRLGSKKTVENVASEAKKVVVKYMADFPFDVAKIIGSDREE